MCHQIFYYLSPLSVQLITAHTRSVLSLALLTCSGVHQYKNYHSERGVAVETRRTHIFGFSANKTWFAKSSYLWCSWLGTITISFLFPHRYRYKANRNALDGPSLFLFISRISNPSSIRAVTFVKRTDEITVAMWDSSVDFDHFYHQKLSDFVTSHKIKDSIKSLTGKESPSLR